jgi:hypothetical protein
MTYGRHANTDQAEVRFRVKWTSHVRFALKNGPASAEVGSLVNTEGARRDVQVMIRRPDAQRPLGVPGSILLL